MQSVAVMHTVIKRISHMWIASVIIRWLLG